jgi:hypothetical protein
LTDGKPGHESQTLGLASALLRLNPDTQIHDIALQHQRIGFWHWLLKRFAPGRDVPTPDLIIGAGHRTHWGLLAARRSYGGHVVALMTPSLPKAWFNTVVAPEHDGLSGANVIRTRGVLNAMRPGEKKLDHTLVLVGGEGKHFIWDDDAVFRAVSQLASASKVLVITDSRRTPTALRQRLSAEFASRYQPWESCSQGWLQAQLASAEAAWVTEDSVSMIYESLSAGCRVGLIALSGGQGRLAQGIATLEADGLVTRWAIDAAPTIASLPARVVVLSEADRVARQLSRLSLGAPS